MRHPFFRVLVALLIGVWSPLCCCQAMTLVGRACESTASDVVAQSTCCPNCPTETSEATEDESRPPASAPDNGQSTHPDDCPSCPSCQGLSGGVGLNVEAELPTFEQQWSAIATIALAVILELPWTDEMMVRGRPPWPWGGWGSPPHVKANRDAQRWHCALTL